MKTTYISEKKAIQTFGNVIKTWLNRGVINPVIIKKTAYFSLMELLTVSKTQII